MRSTLQDIGALNNLAVFSLVRGNIEEAYATLETAVHNFHHNLGDDDGAESSDDDQGAFHGIRAVPIDPELSIADYLFSPENVFQIYDFAFLLRLQNLESDDIAITLLYNFGLVLQRRGILEGKHKFLRKALMIYGMALDLLQDEDLAHRNSATMTLLHLATRANQGFIYYYKLDHENVILCAEHVRDILQDCPGLLASVDVLFFRRIIFYIEVFGFPKNVSPAA